MDFLGMRQCYQACLVFLAFRGWPALDGSLRIPRLDDTKEMIWSGALSELLTLLLWWSDMLLRLK